MFWNYFDNRYNSDGDKLKKNIAYQSPEISQYYAKHRIKWEDFYDSEKFIIEKVGIRKDHEILDIGSGCGGLGLALKEKFGVNKYTGIEVNKMAAKIATKLNPAAKILCGDFLTLSNSVILNQTFNSVFSLSCIDWNTQFDEMLTSSWKHVSDGGALIATFRMVAGAGCDDINMSYQHINFDGEMSGEHAAYVVVNAKQLLSKLMALLPSSITAYGYFGKPSLTAITPYKKICFSGFLIRKKILGSDNDIGTKLDLNLPEEILKSLGLIN